MRDALRLFRKYLPPYKGGIGLNIVFNILHAVFGVFSFITIIPLLRILLGKSDNKFVAHEIDFSLSNMGDLKEAVMNNVYAYVYDLSQLHGASKALIYIGIFFIIMVFFKTLFAFLASFIMVIIRNNVIRDIRNKMYKKLLSLPIGFYTEEKKGDVIARITGDVVEVEHSVMTSLDMFFKNPILIIFYITTMILMSWQLTLFVFILFPIAGAIIGLIGKSLKRHSVRGQNKMGEILSTVEESLSGLRIIKAFNAERVMRKLQSQQNEEYKGIMLSVMSRHQAASPVSEFLGTIVIVMVMWYGGNLILNNESTLNFEEFLIYLVLFFSIINPAKAFSSAFYSIQKGMASMDRIDKILNAENKITSPTKPIYPKGFNSEIEYKDVWFKYRDNYVLKNINLKVEKGKTIALVGQSGSGKSTMVDLLPRFYDVINGSIYIDGNDIRDTDLTSLRNLFGIVNQEPILFNDTFLNNIAFGVEDAPEEKIIEAAKVANAHEFIIQTEKGYNTNIGDRGGKLSGGQRQRISIARAVFKNPPILILDEATSSLDTESERLVQEALTKLMENRTSIVIAHRLSTIVHADEICVLRDGEIVERGRHEELLALNGDYQKFYQMQNF